MLVNALFTATQDKSCRKGPVRLVSPHRSVLGLRSAIRPRLLHRGLPAHATNRARSFTVVSIPNSEFGCQRGRGEGIPHRPIQHSLLAVYPHHRHQPHIASRSMHRGLSRPHDSCQLMPLGLLFCVDFDRIGRCIFIFILLFGGAVHAEAEQTDGPSENREKTPGHVKA